MLCYPDSECYGTEVHPFIFISGYCIHSISLSTVWGAHIVLKASAFQEQEQGSALTSCLHLKWAASVDLNKLLQSSFLLIFDRDV